MKSKNNHRFFLLLFAMAGFILMSGSSFAQEKAENQAKGKKTYTIHVTKEENGNTIVIDTTVITDGDFDADAFLREKGVSNEMPEELENMEKDIVIRHHGMKEPEWNESEENSTDSLPKGEAHVYVFHDRPDFDMAVPSPNHPGMPFNFKLPEGFSQMQGPQLEDMIERMARSYGLEDMMPLGDMKQIVVKKKHHGKQVIITFGDRDKECCMRNRGNRHEEREMEYKHRGHRDSPQNEERVIIRSHPGEKVIIKQDGDKENPEKQPKKVIIIREEKTK